MLTLDDLTLDERGWSENERTPLHRSWWVDGDPVLLRLVDRPAPEASAQTWRVRADRETRAGGGTCLSFDDARVDGCAAFRGVFKFPAARAVPGIAADSLGVYAVGLLVVPLGEQHVLINTEALERGTTGAREALCALLVGRAAPLVAASDRQVDAAGYLALVRESLTMALPSDAPEHDAAVPSHPLSRVRALQRRLVESVRLSPAMRRAAMPR